MGSPHNVGTDDDALTLDPLDGVLVGVPLPFPSTIPRKLLKPLSRLSSLSSFPPIAFDDDETPTTAAASLPTPGCLPTSLVQRSYADVVRGLNDSEVYYTEDPNDSGIFLTQDDHDFDVVPPSAPKIKDMDSFTDGTGAGSFDFTLYSGEDASAQPPPFFPEVTDTPMPTSVAFSPEAPVRSIEVWIDDVHTSASSSSSSTGPRLPIIPHHPYYDEGPRGVKRHLSWTSDIDEDEEGRIIRGRWENYTKPFSEPDVERSGYSMFGGSADLDYSDGPLYASFEDEEDEEGMEHVSDVMLTPPPRPASAPPA